MTTPSSSPTPTLPRLPSGSSRRSRFGAGRGVSSSRPWFSSSSASWLPALCWCRKAPLFSVESVWYVFYPQLRTTGVDAAVVSNTDETYDVLMVGGSTMADAFGNVGTHLQRGLEARLHRPVRVFNLAASCHNTRDSLLKCRHLAHQHFDLVVVYDGINDTRMNNAPPEMFREDYSHCIWYKHLNNLESHPRLFQAAFPFLLLYTKDCVAQACGLSWFVPPRDATPELLEYGKNVRTRRPFQNHLQEIVGLARSNGEKVVLMTFACYIPANYSLEAYRAGQLDYQPDQCSGCPVEIWATVALVRAPLTQPNQAVRDLVARNPDVLFVDQEARMPRSARYFRDCCHLTTTGCRRFAQNILNGLEASNQFPH